MKADQNIKKRVGVILMTYGSATTSENVKAYFHAIYGEKVSPELISDFENRYQVTGGSPLIQITKEQAKLLQNELGDQYIVRAGMRHSEPKITSAIKECHEAGAHRLIGIILSPQFSSFIMDGYRTAFLKAASDFGFSDGTAVIASPWSTEAYFIELLSGRIKDSLTQLRKKYTDISVVFTTHSLPERVVAKDPSYLDQLQSTIDVVKVKCQELQLVQCYTGYQSAGHTPEPWLKPDLTDILDQISVTSKFKNKSSAVPAVLIVPIQFLSDHLEILYDLDIAAREQCEKRAVSYHRIELPNTDPLFIKALVQIVNATQ